MSQQLIRDEKTGAVINHGDGFYEYQQKKQAEQSKKERLNNLETRLAKLEARVEHLEGISRCYGV